MIRSGLIEASSKECCCNLEVPTSHNLTRVVAKQQLGSILTKKTHNHIFTINALSRKYSLFSVEWLSSDPYCVVLGGRPALEKLDSLV